MKKISAVIAALFLCTSLLTGCQETPDEVLVTPKGQNGNSYVEASDENVSNEEETMELMQNIGERLGIESTYSMSLTSPDQRTDFTAENVEIEYPNVRSFPIYEVNLQKFDQDFVDKVTQNLFGDAQIYHEWDYWTRTKSEVMEEIEYMKECKAKGNMDPYNMNYEKSAEKEFDIDKYLSELSSEYDCAPEEYTHRSVTPELGFEPEENGYERPYGFDDYPEDYFVGYAEMDGKIYNYTLVGGMAGDKNTSICITRDRKEDYGKIAYNNGKIYNMNWASCPEEILKDPEGEWVNQYLNLYEDSENLEEIVGISQEEASRQADVLVKKLGLEDWEISYCNPAQLRCVREWGYEFHYVRKVDEIPVLYTCQEVTHISEEDVEKIEETNPAVRYESCTVIVSGEGIELLNIVNLSQLGEVRVKNPELLSWEEIAKKFEDMMLIQYAEMKQGYESDSYHRYFDIEKAVLSYMRIEEAGTDKFLLVPVWDFLGREWNQDKVEHYMGLDAERHAVNGEMFLPWSLMTINAADGSVIDREWGY